MSPESPNDLTQLLRRWQAGDREALEALLPRVYGRLREIARARLRGERPDHTLDTSGLVHEAYLRMAGGSASDWQDRAHFFAVASTAMRHVLIDHAKQRQAEKRGGSAIRVPFEPETWGLVAAAATADPDMLLALDEALTGLESAHPRQAKAIELRYFAGLTLEEAAEVLGTSAPTVMRDLRFAQAWLARSLG
ncbi:MAG TPA: sigma-70 family RNA polymerase sigma factor [Gemmatimonadaceae bacterium]|jgi:RNA polymerase sigma factor (TIGR02999 family)|nr:sigma-70 family RNA polymerase sigma factor [Gemmatimonadaceae bacterium]